MGTRVAKERKDLEGGIIQQKVKESEVTGGLKGFAGEKGEENACV